MGEQSASRLEGDRFQHLYSWYLMLDLLDPEKEIDCVWIEHPQAGAVDDVTVHPESASQVAKYYQIKWHVDHRSGYTLDSLMERGDSATSLLEKFWRSWNRLCETGAVEIWLVSNWAIAPSDPLGELRRGRDNSLSDEFLTAGTRTRLGKWRKKCQDHLGADEQTFAAFYRSLRLRLGFASIAELNEMVDVKMRACKLREGESARGVAIDQIRNWIEEGGAKKQITLTVLKEALGRLNLWATSDKEVGVVVAVHTWAVKKYDLQPDYELDWSAHFDHTNRRVPTIDIWNHVLLPELRHIERTISQKTSTRLIQLRGSLCLSAAFACGYVFSLAGGYRLEIQHRTQTWHSETLPDSTYHLEVVEEIGTNTASDILMVFSVTGDAKAQVMKYAKERNMNFLAHVFLLPVGGPNDFSISGASHAAALARRVRIELRRLLNTYHPKTTHLFYFGPQSLAILIGQKLNACGVIQLYEYQNPGYIPSCLLT